MLEHAFTGPPFTVGIEEELMLLDPDSLDLAQEIEALLAAVPPEYEGQVKPELMQRRARDRDAAVRRTSTRRARSWPSCADRWPAWRPSAGLLDRAPPRRIRSRAGRSR